MTDAERLKVAEELIAAILRGKIDLPDVYVTYSHASKTYYVNRSKSQQSLLASDSDVITAIILARQKLAAEREAAMTPREKRMTEALKQIVEVAGLASPLCNCHRTSAIARKALEDS